MRLRSDDEIYIVDQRWYGPPGRELPWHARYPAYGWGFLMYLLAMFLERIVLGVSLGFQSIVLTLLAVCLATTYLMRKVNPDRPLLTVLRGYWNELRTPRPKQQPSRRVHRHLALARPARPSREGTAR